VRYINNITLSNKTLSLSGNTSLELALKQLVASNNQTGVQLSTCIDADKSRLNQRFAYLAFVFSTGKGNQTSWFDKPNECNWYGTSCIANIVNVINFMNQGLEGSIPDDVGLWTELKYFYAGNNKLTGSLPSSIGLWTSLEVFYVFNNQLAGSLPSSIGRWTSIFDFSAPNNRLTGSLPSTVGGWTRLTRFDVGVNKLTGTVPKAVSNWTSITYAVINANMFNGTMPARRTPLPEP
jgi:hypothetical protein